MNHTVINPRDTVLFIMSIFNWLVAWLSGNALVSINEVTLHRARLVLEWMTVCEWGKPSRYVASQLGRLSLLPSVGW